ncbi:MAG: methyltransferase domain-containing protein [Candidatus Tectomicrobia bacterium]|nr:methyltransferase domain-containing protein [Candidatus Tectomicrobia bacterium]
MRAGGKTFQACDAELNDKEFDLFRTLIWKESGINLGPNKKEFLRTRLLPRLRAIGCRTFRQYYRWVLTDPGMVELMHLLDAISTNLTSFFREPGHFSFLAERALPELLGSRQPHQPRDVRAWSAGCSTGEEAYSLAITLSEYARQVPSLRIKVLGTDISSRVLTLARRGVYPKERLGGASEDILSRYFQRGVGRQSGYLRVKSELAGLVTFARHNVLQEVPFRALDLIFCRNVLIYFARQDQHEVVERFCRVLAPKGYLFVGHSESLAGLHARLRYRQPAVYQRI